MFVRQALDSWKWWIRVLQTLEGELRDPMFHSVQFKESIRRTLTSSINQKMFPVNGISAKAALQPTSLEIGVTFTAPNLPPLFVVLPPTYPVTGINVMGVDTSDVQKKERVLKALSALKRRSISELLNTWMNFACDPSPASSSAM
jgi:hypothetical protein